MKIKLFTNTDVDGAGCSILAKFVFKEVDIECCDYSNINQKIKTFIFEKQHNKYDKVFITDLSISRSSALLINNSIVTIPSEENQLLSNQVFQLFDYNMSDNWVNKYSWVNENEEDYYDPSSSTTKRFYQYLIREKYLEPNNFLNDFVERITKCGKFQWEEAYEDITDKQLNHMFYDVLKLEEKKKKEYIKEKSQTIKVVLIDDYIVGTVFADEYISELGKELCVIYPNLDFIAVIDISKDTISYYGAKDNMDLSKIIKHSQIHTDVKEKILRTIFE